MRRLSFAFHVPGLPFTGATLRERSLGGSETAALCLTRALAKLGHNVHIFTAAEAVEEHEGVHYRPLSLWHAYATSTPTDVIVAQRLAETFSCHYPSKLNVLWQHDLPLGRQTDAFRGTLWNVDVVALLSDYMAGRYREVYGLGDELIWRTRNGVDIADFEACEGGDRDMHRLVYAARPERGLDVLLEHIMPRILEREPQMRLVVAGYDNPVDHLAGFYGHCRALGEKLGCVEWQSFKRTDLYQLYRTSRCMVYPTPSPIQPVFAEISCISAMEAQAAGLPMVTSTRGALSETLPPACGALIDGDPWKPEIAERYADAVLELQGEKHAAASSSGVFHAKHLDWSAVAEQWTSELAAFIRDRNDDDARCITRLVEHGDVQTARAIVGSDEVPKRRREPPSPGSVVELVSEELKRHDGVQKILSYAPAPDTRKLRELIGDGVRVYSGERGKRQPKGYVDALWLSLDVARTPEPWAYIAAAEMYVKIGGVVIISLPYGPAHDPEALWSLDQSDLKHLLGSRDEVLAQSVVRGADPATIAPIGWQLVVYNVAGEMPAPNALEAVERARMFRPRETLSATLMLGGDRVEETLHWCLRSIRDVADEIIGCDCGMSDEARRICARYDVDLIRSRSPLEIGFEGPRNAALERASGDWVLWIDADERLVNASALTKYLRRNMYQGYSIEQHHHAVDATFAPDLPVRVFRHRSRRDGKRMRFFGQIHEHPETGLNEGPGEVLILPDVRISHVGYVDEPTRRGRFDRNAPMLERDKQLYPDRILQKHFIMRDNSLRMQWLTAANGGVPPAEALVLAREICEIYRAHFLGKSTYSHIDPLGYYTQALTVLGEGIEVSFDVRARRDGRGDALNGGTHARFASTEEAQTEIGRRVAQKLLPLDRAEW